MTALLSESGDGFSVTLPPVLGVEAAAELVDALREADQSRPMTMQAAGVETVSTAYVLALVSLLNSRPADAPKVGVVDPAAPFLDAFSDLGYFGELMKMEFLT